jgi:hypothetical protein
VAGVPDLNDDARGDILIGAPGDSPGASPAKSGRAYLYSGKTGVYLRTFFSPNFQAGGEFGTVVSAVNDATGDSRGDVIVSAPDETVAGLADAGRVYVFNGNTGALYRTIISPNNQEGGHFGAGMNGTPDVNFNWRGDVLVGAPEEKFGAGPAKSGRAYIVRN